MRKTGKYSGLSHSENVRTYPNLWDIALKMLTGKFRVSNIYYLKHIQF